MTCCRDHEGSAREVQCHPSIFKRCDAPAGRGNVSHAVRLLDAETPFMQKSGARRIRRLAATGLASSELRKENAPAKLLALLHEGTDEGQLRLPKSS